MNRQSLLNGIRNSLNANNGINFHEKIAKCLRHYCLGLNYHYPYIETKQQGGDKGADFIFVKDNTYFGFTASNKYTLKEVLIKIEEDLSKLLNNIFNEKVYTGKIEKFIFIYNTHGTPKINDPYNKIKELIEKYFDLYDTNFIYEIWNVDDLIDFLDLNCDYEVLIKISEYLNFKDYLNNPGVLSDIRDILNKVEDIENIEQIFIRKITENKIEFNYLNGTKEDLKDIFFSSWFL